MQEGNSADSDGEDTAGGNRQYNRSSHDLQPLG
jgi:hypothetical protein